MTHSIETIMGIILNPLSQFSELKDAIDSLSKFFHEMMDPKGLSILSQIQETQTPYGVALDPVGAKNCLLDVWRTVKYMRGLAKAIACVRKKLPSEQIHIVYAGCGPFAPLVTPLMTIIDTSNLKFTFIDINQASLDIASGIINKLNLSHSNIEFIRADASIFIFSNSPIHIVILEAMTAALYKEGHVSISYNLGKQLEDVGILIPQEVRIRAILADPRKEFEPQKDSFQNGVKLSPALKKRIDLGEIFNLNLNSIKKQKSNSMPASIPASSIRIPENVDYHYHLMLTTEIRLYDDIVLKEYESGLTHPMVYSIGDDFKDNNVIDFYYNTIGVPGFRHTANN